MRQEELEFAKLILDAYNECFMRCDIEALASIDFPYTLHPTPYTLLLDININVKV